MELLGFPKVPNLYNVEPLTGIWSVECVGVQEKIHGTQGRVLVHSGGVVVGTRHRELTEKNANTAYSGQYECMYNVGDKVYRQLAASGSPLLETHYLQLFGEYAGQGVQRGIYYGDTKDFYVFDVVMVNIETGEQEWFDVNCVHEFCKNRGLSTVPLLYVGRPDKDMFDRLYVSKSMVAPIDGGNTVEGIVIKSMPVQFDVYGEIVYAKHKNDKWGEQAPKHAVKVRGAKVSAQFIQFVTRARILHALDKMRDEGTFTGAMCDMRYLPDIIITDIAEEEVRSLDDQELYKEARRYLTKFIARLYKEMLEKGEV